MLIENFGSKLQNAAGRAVKSVLCEELNEKMEYTWIYDPL